MIEMIQNRDYRLRLLKNSLSINRFGKPLEKLNPKERYILEEIFKYEYRIKK